MSIEFRFNASESFKSNSVSNFATGIKSEHDVKERKLGIANNEDRAKGIQTQESLMNKYSKALGDFPSDLKDNTVSEIRDNVVEKGLEKGGKFVEKKLSREVAEEVSKKGLGKTVGKVAGAVAKKANPVATGIGAVIDFKDKIEEGKSVKRSLIEVGGGVAGGAAGGFLAGAAAGALAGSAVPGVGTVIGGIAGAVIGGLAGEKAVSKIADWLGIK